MFKLRKYFRTTKLMGDCNEHQATRTDVCGGGVGGGRVLGGGGSALKYQAKVYHPLFHRQLRSFWQIWSRELVELIIMLSLLMLLLAIMTAVTATGDNKQSAQTTVSSYRKLFINFFRGVAWDFVGVRTRGRKVVVPKAAHLWEVWGHMLLQKFLNLGSRKCHFQRFLQDIFRKFILRKMQLVMYFFLSLVLSVRYTVYGKKRPVTPSKLWNNKRIKDILTQGFGSGEKCIIHSDLMIKNAFPGNKNIFLLYQVIWHEIIFLNATESCTWRRTRFLRSFVIRDWLEFGWSKFMATKGDELYPQDLPIYNTQISLQQRWGKKPAGEVVETCENSVRTKWCALSVIVSSLKGRAHGKARIKLWHLERPRFWSVRNQILSILAIWTWGSKCLVIESHYEDVIMVSFSSPYFSCTRPHGRLSVYAREDATPLTFDNTELKQRRRWRQRERQKSNRFILAKQQLCPCIKLFCTFLCRHCTTSISTDWYQSNQIYRFLLIYRLKNQYRFL